MNRRGMALLLVLWLLVLLSGIAGVSTGRAREGNLQARNRLGLVRAGWAREACLEILMGRATMDSTALRDPIPLLSIDSLDLGEGVWCRLQLSDPGERVHLNRASEGALTALMGDSLLVNVVLLGRPWASTDQLPTQFEPWLKQLTTRGTGRVNLLRAPLEVLATVSGIGKDGAGEIVRVRDGRPTPMTNEELLGRLSLGVRSRILSVYDHFAAESYFRTLLVTAESEGHVRERPVVARMTVTLVPVANRFAVIRREVE